MTPAGRGGLLFAAFGLVFFGGIGAAGLLLDREVVEPVIALATNIINVVRRNGRTSTPYDATEYLDLIHLYCLCGILCLGCIGWLILTRSKDNF